MASVRAKSFPWCCVGQLKYNLSFTLTNRISTRYSQHSSFSLSSRRVYSDAQGSKSFKDNQRMQQLVLRIQDPGPNPQTVGILLEELGLPFVVKHIGDDGQRDKDTQYIQDGGAPAVEDKNTGMIILHYPNSDVSLWESLAIVEYLVQTYDKEEKLRYASSTQNWWICEQWLAYQMGAQSPFVPLKAWFSHQHRENVPSVIGRFSDNVVRIASMLKHYLAKVPGEYLAGEKCTYADLVFVPWNNKIAEVMGKAEASKMIEKHPHYRKWHERLMNRPAIQRIMQNHDLSTQWRALGDMAPPDTARPVQTSEMRDS